MSLIIGRVMPAGTSVLLGLFTNGRFMKKICVKRRCVIVCNISVGLACGSLVSSRLVSLNLGEYI